MNTPTMRDTVAQLPVDEALQQLVDSLIASFDEEAGQWKPCWSAIGSLPHNATTGVPYRGINTLMLWAAQIKRQYQSPRWATYKQWQSIGAQVQRGAKGVRCVKWVELAKRDPDDETKGKIVPKIFTVFNPVQVDGAPVDESEGLGPDADWWLHWMGFREPIPVTVLEGGPCYVPAADTVMVPKLCLFDSPELYCRTLAHELGHWTGHADRLDRHKPERYEGIEEYAYEELVAEISASLTCAWLHVPETAIVHTDHVLYIKYWLAALANEPRILLSAAQQAQHASDHLLDYSRKEGLCLPVHPD